MPHKDFNLVLRYDSQDTTMHDSLKDLMKEKGREIETAAKLIHAAAADGSPPPKVVLYSDDYFLGTEDIEVGNAEEAEAADNKSG